MAVITRGSLDVTVDSLKQALEAYEAAHPGAEATLYRQNPGSIRVRVVDDRFAGIDKSARHDAVWDFLAGRVGEDVMGEVYVLLTFSHAELGRSLANQDFEDPLP